MDNTLTFHVERDLGPFDQREFALEVTYSVNPYRPATHLQPAEGGDCEIISVLHDGVEFDLTDAEEDLLQQYCIDDANERGQAEMDAYADYKYEQYRERMVEAL